MLIKEENHFQEIDDSTIENYKKVPGVWILIGKEKGNKGAASWVCLQVAKTMDIRKEIVCDKSYFTRTDKGKGEKRKKYVNQFGEYKFSYGESENRRKILYEEIYGKYDDLTFIPVAYGEKMKNDALRKAVEKYIAYQTSCIYWVNGRPYQEGKSLAEIKLIQKECKKECEERNQKWFQPIKEKYKEELEELKEFLTNLSLIRN